MLPRVKRPNRSWESVFPALFAFTAFGLGLLIATPFFAVFLAPFYIASL